MKILLGYDADTSLYEKSEGLRQELIKELISSGATNLVSYVRSMITFEVSGIDINTLNIWEGVIQRVFKNKVYFQLSIIHEIKTIHNMDKTYSKNFQLDILNAKKK